MELSRNGGGSWSTLSSSATSPYPYTVTTPTSTNCRVRVTSNDYPTASDTSNASFTIAGRSVTVTYPNGGEVWMVGQIWPVTWESKGIAADSTMKVEISRDGGAIWTVINPSTPNDGVEAYTVTTPTSTNCRVRVTSNAYPTVSDTSSASFTVGVRSLTVTYPNGGESWYVGQGQTITWASQNAGTTFKVELSSNGGSTWTTLSTTAVGSSYPLTVATPTSTNCRVRVTSNDYPAVSDTSNASFSINPRTIKVTYPNGGEVWYGGQSQAITWQSFGIPPESKVKIELSRDGGTTWTVLSAATPNDGTYPWKVAAPVSSTCKVRVSSLDYASVTDRSNADFTIGLKP